MANNNINIRVTGLSELTKANSELKEINQALITAKRSSESFSSTLNSFKDISTIVKGVGDFSKAISKLAEENDNASASSNSFSEVLSSLPGTIGTVGTAVGIAINVIEGLWNFFSGTEAKQEKFNRAMESAKTAIDAVTDSVSNYKDSMHNASGYVSSFGQTLALASEEYRTMQSEMMESENQLGETYRLLAASRTELDEESYKKYHEIYMQKRELTEDEISDLEQKLESRAAISDTERQLIQGLLNDEWIGMNDLYDKRVNLSKQTLDLAASDSEQVQRTAKEKSEYLMSQEDMTVENFLANTERERAAMYEQADIERQLIQDETSVQLQLLYDRHKELGTLNSEEYTNARNALYESEQEKLGIVDQGIKDTLGVYLDYTAEMSGIRTEDYRHNASILKTLDEMETDYQKAKSSTLMLGEEEHRRNLEKLNFYDENYEKLKSALQDQLIDEQLAYNEESSGAILALADDYKANGGELTGEAEYLVTATIAAFQALPPGMEGVGYEAMEALIGSLDFYQQEVEDKVNEILLHIEKLKGIETYTGQPYISSLVSGSGYALPPSVLDAFNTEESSLVTYSESTAPVVNSVSPLRNFTNNLKRAISFNQARLSPALAGGYGGFGGTTIIDNHTELEQTISSPKALSPSEMTREAENFLRRSRWQNP